jgi:hypothetical protein
MTPRNLFNGRDSPAAVDDAVEVADKEVVVDDAVEGEVVAEEEAEGPSCLH